MTAEAALRALAAAATPGPWVLDPGEGGCWAVYGPEVPLRRKSDGEPWANGATEIPRVLREGCDYDDYGDFPDEATLAWIVALNPAVGLAVAEGLEAARALHGFARLTLAGPTSDPLVVRLTEALRALDSLLDHPVPDG